MDSPPRITISNDFLEAEIAPHLGARLCRLRALNDGVDLVVPLVEWDAPPHGWPKAGAYPLIPYSNRIRDATLKFGHHTHALAQHPLDRPNALHGHAQRRAWEVVTAGSQRAELALHSDACADWPWPFAATFGFELIDNSLRVGFSVSNRGERPMPVGLGWHPFFATDAQSTLRFDAARRWELDGRCLPTGRSFGATARTELSRASWADADCVEYVSEWDGTAVLERDAGTLRITADSPLTHLVVFAARGAGFVCIEPVSHVADGFNLAAQGIDGTGMQVLEPGESLASNVTLAWESAR
jgi:aldose 1-epimerase